MKRIPFSLLAVFTATTLFSQSRFVQTDFLIGGVNDAQKLFTAYITPWANMFGTSLSGGWYNTAKPHKLLGFDLTITANCAIAPSAEKTFDISTLGLQTLQVNPASASAITPTIAGSILKDGPSMDVVTNLGTVSNAFKMPKGTGIPITLLPMAQLGIGFIKGTEFMVRYGPPINYGKSGTMDLWGVGVKHSIFQYLPASKAIPLDVSVMFGYTKFHTGSNVNFRPTYKIDYDADVPASFNDQKMQMTVGVWTANLLISTTLPLINVYGGIGYAGTSTNLKLAGSYPIPSGDIDAGTQHLLIHLTDIKKDPVNMKIDTKSAMRYNLGVRLKFGILTWHVDYTYAYYSMVSTGLGISFR
jgi:hypothetical protein